MLRPHCPDAAVSTEFFDISFFIANAADGEGTAVDDANASSTTPTGIIASGLFDLTFHKSRAAKILCRLVGGDDGVS